MTLPPRIRTEKREKVRRRFPKHAKWVRSHQCCVRNESCFGEIHAHHVRVGGDGGTGLRPNDWYLVSLCAHHHDGYHHMGHETFEREYRIDLQRLAREFAEKSPDIVMRNAMKERQDK